MPPLEFRGVNSLCITSWLNNHDHPSGITLLRAVSQILERHPQIPTQTSDANLLSHIRSRLILAKTLDELCKGLYSLEEFLYKNPYHPEARLLAEKYKLAIERDRAIFRLDKWTKEEEYIASELRDISLLKESSDWFLTRIIHQPQKSTRESAFEVRIARRATASPDHPDPKTSPSGCPGSVQIGRTVAIGHTASSQPA